MTDVPGGAGPDEPEGPSSDPWDAWRRWSRPTGDGGGAATSPWDAWKTWDWSPRRRATVAPGRGCGSMVPVLVAGIVLVVVFVLPLINSMGGAEHLPADDLIATIDGLAVTGPRDQRPRDAAAGETATFPAPGATPDEVAREIEMAKAPDVRQEADSSVFLLYEEATVAVEPAQGTADTEVVVFEENRDATRRYPLLIGLPGWSGALDTFDDRARSRGGIGGFRGGGGGFAK